MRKKSSKNNNKLIKSIKDDLHSTSKFTIFEVIIIIFISLFFGIIIGYIITYTNSSVNSIRSDSNLSEIVSTYDNIKKNYYKKVDEDKLSEAAIRGMINSLDDPNSSFLDDQTTEQFNESIDGNFVGIGVTIKYESEYNKIIKVNDLSPAAKAGLKVDDIIVSVDGTDCKGISGNEISKLIKGKIGTKVKIKVKRGDSSKTFVVERDTIDIESVTYSIDDVENKKIGYIKIDMFASNTYDQFNKALQKLEKKNIDSLIIDVRGNPGGHLAQVRKILSLFFDKKTVLYQIKSSSKQKKIYSLSKDVRTYPVVILVDEKSASASEVLAACFKDNYKNASLVGTKTYGKGTVQKSQSLFSGTSIKLTVESWLTPKGKSVDGKGLDVDYEVELDGEYFETRSFSQDSQYQKALEILKKSQ